MDKIINKLNKLSIYRVAFLQGLLQMGYIGLVAILFWKGNELFGKVPNYLGPVLFLTLFVASALISALIVLGYPFYLFWEEKKTKKSLELVAYTTAWLIAFLLLTLLSLIILR